jgi:hypothetical protein
VIGDDIEAAGLHHRARSALPTTEYESYVIRVISPMVEWGSGESVVMSSTRSLVLSGIYWLEVMGEMLTI